MEQTRYIDTSRQAHVHLFGAKEELVWSYSNLKGRYFAKSGYQAMVNGENGYVMLVV
jgi:hypothetical protein